MTFGGDGNFGDREQHFRDDDNRFDEEPKNFFAASFAGLISGIGKAGIAGTMAGIWEETAGYPLDIIKTRMQVQHVPQGALSVFRDIIKKEGVWALFSGLGSPVAASAFMNSALFGTYGKVLAQLKALDVNDPDVRRRPTMKEASTAGAIGGFVQCFIACPFEVVKARMQVQGLYAGHPEAPEKATSSWQMGKNIFKNGGIPALYKGMIPTLLRDVPGFAVYFAAYETLKDILKQTEMVTYDDVESEGHEDGFAAIIIAGGTAGMLHQVCTYPIDVVKSHIQVQPHHHDHHYLYSEKHSPDGKPPPSKKVRKHGMLRVIRRLYKSHGIPAFFRGVSPTAIKAFPSSAVGFLAYELTLRILPDWAFM